MIPNNVAFYNFTRTRVNYTGAHSISSGTGYPPKRGITYIFGAPVRIFFFGWSYFSNNRIFKSRFAKSFIPLFNTRYSIRVPPLWYLTANPEHNRFNRL